MYTIKKLNINNVFKISESILTEVERRKNYLEKQNVLKIKQNWFRVIIIVIIKHCIKLRTCHDVDGDMKNCLLVWCEQILVLILMIRSLEKHDSDIEY